MSDDHYKKLAVLGHPIKQSKSPIIHKHWIEKYDVQGDYAAIDIPPAALEHEFGELIAAGYNGFNVTAPHKQDIMQYCDARDRDAYEIGAVNTLYFKGNKLWGSNTDSYGFIENLENSVKNFDWTKGPAVILGAGGAARAIANASDIVADMGGYVMPWDQKEEALLDANLLINTTSLGMTGKAPLEINLDNLPQTATVYDIVYAPLITPLLEQAQARGNQTVTGIGMLLYQAQKAFEIWYGIKPDVDDDLIEKVLK